MDFTPSPAARAYLAQVEAFMASHVYPAEQAILTEAMNQSDDFRQCARSQRWRG